MDALGASGLDIEFLSARPVGMLAVHRSRVAEMPDANLRQALQAAAPDLDATSGSTGLFFIGGHAGLRGGGAVRRDGDPSSTEGTLAALTARALTEAAAVGAVPVALYVPHDQVPAMSYAWLPAVRLVPGPQLSVLRLDGAATMEEFLAARTEQARYTWRQDRHGLEAAGVRAGRCAISPELMAEAAPLIAAVKIRNGVLDDPRLTEFRLRGWLAAYGSGGTAWTVRTATGGGRSARTSRCRRRGRGRPAWTATGRHRVPDGEPDARCGKRR